MTAREIELFVIAARLAKSLDDACPDVGFGTPNFMLVQDIAKRLTFPVSDKELKEIVDKL